MKPPALATASLPLCAASDHSRFLFRQRNGSGAPRAEDQALICALPACRRCPGPFGLGRKLNFPAICLVRMLGAQPGERCRLRFPAFGGSHLKCAQVEWAAFSPFGDKNCLETIECPVPVVGRYYLHPGKQSSLSPGWAVWPSLIK